MPSKVCAGIIQPFARRIDKHVGRITLLSRIKECQCFKFLLGCVLYHLCGEKNEKKTFVSLASKLVSNSIEKGWFTFEFDPVMILRRNLSYSNLRFGELRSWICNSNATTTVESNFGFHRVKRRLVVLLSIS